MRQQSDDRTQVNNILTHIDDGMQVYDRHGKEVGTVERVYFGAVEETDYGQEPDDDNAVSGISLTDAFADALDIDDELPEVLRRRLTRYGYIRVNGPGLFAADRYIMPDQIDRVADDRVILRIDRDDLIRD